MDDIIAVVQEKITASGMMQKAVAERAGIDEQALSAALNGRRRLLATEFIALCKVLGITAEDIDAMHE